VELTILQHGVTPLEGVKPRVMVSKTGSSERLAFPARPTSEPGVYRANVVFASAGTWTYAVDDGFVGVRTYPPVSIGSGGESRGATTAGLGGGGGDGPDYLLAFSLAAIAGLTAGLAAAAVQRRRGDPASDG
jgi:hypothetical protein